MSTVNVLFLENANMVINKALLKYGYSNFKLEILEYCDPENIVDREQHYLDLLKPEYNVLKDAGSSLGFKHSEESLAKVRAQLSKLNFEKGFKIEVTDTETNTFTTYDSVRKAAKALNCVKTSLLNYEAKQKAFESGNLGNDKSKFQLFRGRYIINIIRPE